MDAARHAEHELVELKRRFADAESRWSGERATLAAERRTLIAERDALTRERDELSGRLTTVTEERDRLDRMRAHLLALLSKHVRARFGRLSETMSLEQMSLFAQVLEREAAAGAAESSTLGSVLVGAHRRKRKGRRAIPDDLPRETVVHDLGEDRKVCPTCQEPLVPLSAPVRTERLEFEPARLKVLVELRPTYVCPCGCGHVARADLPPRAVERCKAAPGLLAAVAVSKFGDHQPLYRQEGIFQRSGVEIGRSTMCDWMRQVGEAVEPLVELIRARVRASRIIQSDDTPVNVLDPGRGKTRQGRFWVYLGSGPGGGGPGGGGADPEHPPHRCRYAAFDFSLTREGRWAREWLGGFAGFLQVDAFAGYDALFKEGRVTEVGCWAHARRHFFDAREFDKERCEHVLGLIGKLYAVERHAAGGAVSLASRRAELRKTHAAPVLEELRAYLESQAGRVLPRSGVGQAIEYTLRNWKALTRYLDHGDLEIDNNASERAIKTVALGRKNWLFIGHELAGPTAARLMTLIGSARLHEIEPWAYLKDVLERIAVLKTPADLEPLLPDHWKAAHPRHHLALAR